MKHKFLISISVLGILLSNQSSAEIASGTNCGTTCSWSIDDDGVLTVWGTGENGTGSVTATPWNASDVTSLNLQEGLTTISLKTFIGMSSVTGELKIPSTVRSIGSYAFSGMSSITGELKIPDGVTSIGAGAFYGMSSITGELKIPSGLTSIEYGTFSDMSSVTGELKIPQNVTSIGGCAFRNMSGVTGELKIPENVTFIGSGAFQGMSSITGELKIPDGVTTIEADVFKGMSSVTGELKIPNGVTSIGLRAFGGMSGLTSVVIPDSVEEIGLSAFGGVNISSITCNEDNLARFLARGGRLQSDAQIICTSGECEEALKGTQYAGLIGNVVYPRKEVGQTDGSVAIYKKGKLVGFKKKRIYTVDEVEFLSKPHGNKFKVRYK